MLTTLSFQRRQILQISLLASVILFFANLITSAYLVSLLLSQDQSQEIQENLQQQNLEQAIDIINEQTL